MNIPTTDQDFFAEIMSTQAMLKHGAILPDGRGTQLLTPWGKVFFRRDGAIEMDHDMESKRVATPINKVIENRTFVLARILEWARTVKA